MIKLKIKQYITENNTIPHKILESLLEKQQVLLISAMKTGKTSFVMHYLVNKFRELNIQLIFISPTRSLLDNIQSKYKVIKCNGDVKSIKLNNLIPIVSTPDSLPKAIEACETGNKQFILVYDEAHQVIENISFREKLKNPFLIYKNDLCIALLAMTATPEPLENINFDQKFYIDVENKFYIANNTVIVKNFIDSIDSKLAFIRHVKSIHKDKTIFARINNKKDIKLLKDRLNNSIAWYRADNELKEGKEYIEHMEIFEDTLTGKDIKCIDYVLTSSLGDVGVEYLLENKPVVIDFIDNNSSLVADIQFSGRFRNGIDTLYFVSKFNTDKENFISKEPKQKLMYEEELRKRKELIKLLNSVKMNNPITDIGIKTIKTEEGNLKFELDEYSLKQYIHERCVRFHLQNANLFKRYLKNHLTFNTKNIEIVDFQELKLDVGKELKLENKLLREQQKQLEKNFYVEMKKIFDNKHDKSITEIILNTYYFSSELWKVKEYLELIKLWESEKLEKYRERYRELKNIIPIDKRNKFNELELLNIALKTSTLKDFKLKLNYITYNVAFNNNSDLENINKEMLFVYEIRKYILKIKGKERDVCLSKKIKLELLEHLKKKKSLSKLSPNILDKHLHMIYNISTNNQNRDIIKSIKIKL